MWKVEIEKIDNGYILSWKEEIENGTFRTEKEVIEEDDTEKETMSRLLHRIAEFFGDNYDKYGAGNLKISWNKKVASLNR